MPKSSAMTIRVDPEIKSQADNVLRFLGMTTSEAVTIFLRQVILNNGIPFAIQAPASTLLLSEQDLLERSADFESGRNIVTHDIVEI
jgi:addiction module RelB/DinJ family antitoxin